MFAGKKDNNNNRLKRHRTVYGYWYKSRDAFTFGNGKQWRGGSTWPLEFRHREIRQNQITGRNTLSQLHWLYHSVNTHYRQDVIANIWWVWIYKNQKKSLQLPSPLTCNCVHCMMGLCLAFLSVHSMTWERIAKPVISNLIHPYVMLLCHSCWHHTELVRYLSVTTATLTCQDVDSFVFWVLASPLSMPDLTVSHEWLVRLASRKLEAKSKPRPLLSCSSNHD